MDRLWSVERGASSQLSRRDPALVRPLPLCLLHLQAPGLPQCPLACLCGSPAHQGVRDSHSGEAEHEAVEDKPGISGLCAEHMEAYSFCVLAVQLWTSFPLIVTAVWFAVQTNAYARAHVELAPPFMGVAHC